MPDISIIDEGALITLIPNTNAAKKTFRHLVIEPFQVRPDGSILVDAWIARELVKDLHAEDLTIEGAEGLLH